MAKSLEARLDGRLCTLHCIPVAEGGQTLCTFTFKAQGNDNTAGTAPHSYFRENSDVAGIVLSEDFQIQDVNSAARQLFKTLTIPQTGVLDKRIARPQELHLLKELAGEELHYCSKIRFEYYEIRLRWYPQPAQTPCFVIRLRKLTSKVRVYKRLQECNYRYKTVFQNVRIGMFQTTPGGKLIVANPALANMLGYSSPEQLMQEVGNMRDLYVRPARRKTIVSHIATHGFVADVESDVRRRDGSIVRLSGTTVGMKDSTGRLIMLQGTIVDTSRYGKRQKVIDILEKTVYKISDSIIISTFEHEIIYVNEAFTKLYGYRLEDLNKAFDTCEELGRHISFSGSRIKDKAGTETSVGSLTTKEGSYSGEHLNYGQAGDEIRVDVASSLIQDEFGVALAYMTISRDITRHYEAENRLLAAKKQAEEANQLKANILSNMSHELRTPLTGIIGFASMLKDMLTDQDEELLYFLDNIKHSGERLLETLNTILMVSDIESQRVRYNFRLMPFRELVKDTMDRLSKHANGQALSISLREEEAGILVYADYDLLRQAFEKVYGNALKFTEEGSVDVLIGRHDEDTVYVRVADTGVGIPEEDKQHIFAPFTQVSSGMARKYQGTGLGLYVCKSYVELLNGRIEVESKKEEGSVFTIYLPASAPSA